MLCWALDVCSECDWEKSSNAVLCASVFAQPRSPADMALPLPSSLWSKVTEPVGGGDAAIDQEVAARDEGAVRPQKQGG